MIHGRVATLTALGTGIAFWLALPLGPEGEHGRIPAWRWAMVALVIALAAMPALPGWICRISDRLRGFSRGGRLRAAVFVFLGSAIYLFLTAVNQDRDLFPKTHDECSYAIGVRQLATGRLWYPQHPLADFFDSFYLISQPVYASMYFPGTALLNVAGVWARAPFWVIPLLVASAIVALTFHILAELVSPAGGFLAAVFLLSLTWFRSQSVMLMSQLPLLLLGLVAMRAWLTWRESRRIGWVVLIGATCGWAAITRPLDAVCFAIPIGLLVAVESRRALSFPSPVNSRESVGAGVQPLAASGPLPGPPGQAREGTSRPWAPAGLLFAMLLGAAPFLILQGVCNFGITGSLTRTPFDLYATTNYPGTAYGFHDGHGLAIKTPVVQKALLYNDWVKPYIERHTFGRLWNDWWTRRLPLTFESTLPARPLIALLPLGLLGLTDRRRLALAAVVPLFLLLYVGYTFYLEHYALVLAPSVAMLLVLAVRQVGEVWPAHRERLTAAATLAVLAFCATGTWELNHWDGPHRVSDEPYRSVLMRRLNDLSDRNEIILFKFDASHVPLPNIQEEPVYNTDVAWPDDARIIRAHDLGERNVELFRYYARTQPERVVQTFDLATGEVRNLGSVRNLAGARAY